MSWGEVKQIAWVSYQGDVYGVAHDSKGEALGNVRIERKADHFYITAYTFKDNMGVEKIPYSEGINTAKRVAGSRLKGLIEAAA